MADVTIEIGGRRYDVTCRDGEEEQLRRLGALVDEKAAQARAAVGGVTEVRQLLLAALLLADEVTELRAARNGRAANGAADADLIAALEQLAARAETMAAHLESRRPDA
jgi:cell division protein ZapA